MLRYLFKYMGLFFHICQNEEVERFIDDDLFMKRLFCAFLYGGNPPSIWYSKMKPNILNDFIQLCFHAQ